MDEVFFGECPDTEGQPPDAARQPGSELERTARPSGTERGRTKRKGGADGRRALLATRKLAGCGDVPCSARTS